MSNLPFEQQLFTESDCYKRGRKIKVKGLMLHSTGANNPYLSRYIQPDDGKLGKNRYNNDWNRPGLNVCVHGFIGKDTNGVVRTYQTLPWEHRGWHGAGSVNDTHISVELCEDGLNDREYFNEVYKQAVSLFAHLAKHFKLKYTDILDHSEAHKLGLASNHGDVMHWFPKHGKSMKTFRLDVKAAMEKGSTTVQKPATAKPSAPAPKTVSQLADEVMRGVHGSGRDRMRSLGSQYSAVQIEVNRRLKSR